MGYTRHHAILVTTFSKKDIKVAHKKAKEIFPQSVSAVNETFVNSYYSFAVFPDGSKEGWQDSSDGNERRKTFVAWLREQVYEDNSAYYTWVEVQYGDDDHITRIVSHSDENAQDIQ